MLRRPKDSLIPRENKIDCESSRRESLLSRVIFAGTRHAWANTAEGFGAFRDISLETAPSGDLRASALATSRNGPAHESKGTETPTFTPTRFTEIRFDAPIRLAALGTCFYDAFFFNAAARLRCVRFQGFRGCLSLRAERAIFFSSLFGFDRRCGKECHFQDTEIIFSEFSCF